MCTRGRTVLATSSEPAHDLGLCDRLLVELRMEMCLSCACAVAVRRAAVAIAHRATCLPEPFLYTCVCTVARVHRGVRDSSWALQTPHTDVFERGIGARARDCRLKHHMQYPFLVKRALLSCVEASHNFIASTLISIASLFTDAFDFTETRCSWPTDFPQTPTWFCRICRKAITP